jgi:hypothetical protein
MNKNAVPRHCYVFMCVVNTIILVSTESKNWKITVRNLNVFQVRAEQDPFRNPKPNNYRNIVQA